MNNYPNVHILDHPLIRHKVAIIRDKNTSTKQFREVIGEIATLMAFEAFKEVPTQKSSWKPRSKRSNRPS